MACGDDGGGATQGEGDAGNEDSTNPAPTDGDAIDEAVLAACPQSSTLIETTDWTSCVEGKRLTGVEPFSSAACELRIGADGAMDYLVDGSVVISIPDRSGWGAQPYGTYQNDASGMSRFMLASVAPDLEAVEGEPRVTRITVSLFALEGQEDTVAVDYLDAALARKTYNCTVQAL